MKSKIFGAVLLCVMMLVGAVACSSSGGKAPNGMTAGEILAMSQNASASINTLQMDEIENTNVMGEEMNMSISMSMDKSNRIMNMSEISPMSTGAMECYILNDWMYISDPIAEAQWVKTPLTEDIWNQEDTVNQQLSILSNFTDAQYIGTELVGNANCYEINVNPNMAAILGALNMSDIGNVSLSDMVKSCSGTVWIDENTYYPLKTSLDVTLEVENVTVSANEVGTISNINQPVNIVLPAAAQNATSISYSDFESGNW